MRRLLAAALSLIVMATAVFAFPPDAAGASKKPDVDGTTAILIDAKTGDILWSKNKDVQMSPASTTKIMTALLAIENLKMDTVITVDAKTARTEGNTIYMSDGEEFTVEQLVKAMMVTSANDAAVALAKAISGTVKDFSNLMNGKARELGAKNTHFVNPNGLDSTKHVSTAYDMAMIAKEAMKNETFREIVKLKKYTVPKTNKSDERKLQTTNRLLYDKSNDIVVNGEYRKPYYKDAIGIKTGYTPVAQGCLVAAAKRGDTELIAVVMHSSDFGRFADVIEMFEYGFDSFSTYDVFKSGDTVGETKVRGGKPKTVEGVADYYLSATLKKGEEPSSLTHEVVWKEKLTSPVKKGDVIGTAKLYKGTELINETDVRATSDIEESLFGFMYNGHVAHPVKLILFIIFMIVVLLVIVALVWREINRRKAAKRRKRQAMKIARERKYGHRK